MYDNTHGAMPGAGTPKKISAGGCDTTTADTNNATQTIALHVRIMQAMIRLAASLAVAFRGLV
jgi:hypothetical protein